MRAKWRCCVILMVAGLTGLVWQVTLLAAPPQPHDWKTLRIGIDSANPPFSSIDPDQVADGFDVYIAKALCAKMKVTCEFVAAARAALLPDLLSHRSDAVIASLARTDEARKTVDFTDRYEALAARFAIARSAVGNDISPESMRGKTVGAVAGSRYAAYLAETYGPKGVTIKLYNSDEDADTDLAKGRIAAVLGGSVQLYRWFEAGGGGRCCRLVGSDVHGPRTLGEGAGIAVRKEDGDLRDMLNKALADILRDGTYEKINAIYFDFLIY